jgi:hypothetical protein
VPFLFSTGSQGVPHFDGSQTPDLCTALRLRAMVSQAAKAPLLPDGIYGGHLSCGRKRQCADALFRPATEQSSLLFKQWQAYSSRKHAIVYTTSSDRPSPLHLQECQAAQALVWISSG